MKLWIRSQDREILLKVNELEIEENMIIAFDNNKYQCLGTYKTKERSLEVLDEIAAMIKNRYIVKPSGILSTKDIANEYIRLNRVYNGEFIMENPPFEIESINSNIIYYEMPEE